MAIWARAGHGLAEQRDHRCGGIGRGERGAQVQCSRGGEDLDGQHRGEAVDGRAQLAGRRPAHGDVVLLHRTGGDGIDAGGDGEALEVVHNPGSGVLRDHVPAVEPGLVREEGRQPMAAMPIEHAVGTPLRHARDVSDRDGEEVERVADRCAVEVAIALHAAIDGHDRVVDGRGEFALGNDTAVVERVACGTVDLGRAAQGIGVLHAGVVRACVARHDGRVAQHAAHVGRTDALPGVGAEPLQVVGQHLVRAQEGLDGHRGRDVGSGEEHLEVRESQHQHAEHAVGAVDEREPFLLGQLHRREPGRSERVGSRHQRTRAITHVTLAHQRECDVRQRCEITGAAERSVLAHSRQDPGVHHGGVSLRGRRAHSGASGGEGVQAQQHRRAHHLGLNLRTPTRGVRADERLLQMGPRLRRDVHGGECTEPCRDAVRRFR